ncbi:MAG TPA: efflux RND transporter periplasmic adaptor subunit [Gemmataceae bacterium]|nr:efflux RND transporter periplasmic adaptor subunit [Gemmataceae bacterium]
MRTRGFRTLVAGLAFVLATFANGCGNHGETGSEGTSDAPSMPVVTVASPERRALARSIEQPARVEAFEETPIFAKIAGYVKQVNVDIGSKVRKGDVLATLWVPEVVEQLKEREALVGQAGIEIEQAKKNLAVARATVVTARSMVQEAIANRKRSQASLDRWKSESGRIGGLVREKVIEKESGEEVANQFRSASAAMEESEAKVQSAQALLLESIAKSEKSVTDVSAATNRLVVAEAEKRETQAMLAYADITAPYDGVVSHRNVHTGHFLQPSTSGGSRSEALFTVVRMDKVRVFLEVPEADAVLVKDGVSARIRIPVLNDQEFRGNVSGSSWSLEPNQRTLRTEIDFNNADGRLRPGMYAQAVIDVIQPETFTVPSQAVQTRDGMTFCYCAEDGKAVRVPLRLGVRSGASVEVRKKQLRSTKPGEKPRWVDVIGSEQVIVTSSADLEDGQTIRVGKEH